MNNTISSVPFFPDKTESAGNIFGFKMRQTRFMGDIDILILGGSDDGNPRETRALSSRLREFRPFYAVWERQRPVPLEIVLREGIIYILFFLFLVLSAKYQRYSCMHPGNTLLQR